MFRKNTAKGKIGQHQRGFTIIELMIAISVFAIVLVIATTGVITIGKIYHKGITSSKAQEAARSIVSDISETIQFSGYSKTSGGGFPGAQTICFGYDRYTYFIGSQVGEGSNGLMYDRRPELGNCEPVSPADAKELLPQNTRLASFKVESVTTGTYRINVKIAYGDNDLLAVTQCNGSATDEEDTCSNPTEEDFATLKCREGIAGNNFCSVSELETIVNKRVK